MVDNAWFGYSDQTTEGTWKWVNTGRSDFSSSYTNWKSGEPDDSGDCALMNKDGVWEDQHCTQKKYPFLCGFSKSS